MMRKNSILHEIPEIWLDTKRWPRVDPDALSEPLRGKFIRRRKAITALLAGASYKEIERETGVSDKNLRRLLRRCTSPDGEGHIFGERALICYVHLKVYQRTVPINRDPHDGRGFCSGALTNLFKRFPEIEHRLIRAVLGKESASEEKIAFNKLHERFIKECTNAGLADTGEWPFNTLTQGKTSLRNFFEQLANQRPSEYIKARHGADAVTRLAVGRGYARSLLPQQAYDIVGIDELTFDAVTTITIPVPSGGEQDVVIKRIHIVLVIEVVSRAICAWYPFFSESVRSSDMRQAIQRALTPWQPMAFTIPGLEYGAGDVGMPSGLIPALKYHAWTTLVVDNALAHQDTHLLADLATSIGSMVNLGPVAAWYRRSEVERTIKEVLVSSAQRLPSTTGNSPVDPRKKDPAETAVRYKVRWTDVRQVVEVVIARYNARATEGLGGLSPIALLRQLTESPDKFFRRPLPLKYQTPNCLTQVSHEVTVCGCRAKGTRPFVRVDRGVYTNPNLANAWHLIGKKLFLSIDEDDMRWIRASVVDSGLELGVLALSGQWGKTAHTRAMRKEINRLIRCRAFSIPPGSDPIQEYLQYLSSKARQETRRNPTRVSPSANRLAEVEQRTGLHASLVKERPSSEVDFVPQLPANTLRPSLREVLSLSSFQRKGQS